MSWWISVQLLAARFSHHSKPPPRPAPPHHAGACAKLFISSPYDATCLSTFLPDGVFLVFGWGPSGLALRHTDGLSTRHVQLEARRIASPPIPMNQTHLASPTTSFAWHVVSFQHASRMARCSLVLGTSPTIGWMCWSRVPDVSGPRVFSGMWKDNTLPFLYPGSVLLQAKSFRTCSEFSSPELEGYFALPGGYNFLLGSQVENPWLAAALLHLFLGCPLPGPSIWSCLCAAFQTSLCELFLTNLSLCLGVFSCSVILLCLLKSTTALSDESGTLQAECFYLDSKT